MAIDPGLAAIVTAGAFASKDTINKLLGPTADYLGELLQGQVQKRAENIGRIFKKAAKKLGSKIDEPGQVHPKLLKEFIIDGSFCEDELTAEYYGGVLASSRTGISRDDRGASYLLQISHLSTYQVRTHFICYAVLRGLFKDIKLNPGTDCDEMRSYIPLSEYCRAMAFNENNETSSFAKLCLDHSLTGLGAFDLIRATHSGSRFFLSKQYRGLTFPKSGFTFQPTLSGIELYLWANGYGNLGIGCFLSPEIKILVPNDITIPNNAFSIKKEHKRQQNKSQQSKP